MRHIVNPSTHIKEKIIKTEPEMFSTTLLWYHLHTIKVICFSGSIIFSKFTELGNHRHATVLFLEV